MNLLHRYVPSLTRPSIRSVNKRADQRKGEKICFLSSVIKFLTASSHGEGTQKSPPQALNPFEQVLRKHAGRSLHWMCLCGPFGNQIFFSWSLVSHTGGRLKGLSSLTLSLSPVLGILPQSWQSIKKQLVVHDLNVMHFFSGVGGQHQSPELPEAA